MKDDTILQMFDVLLETIDQAKSPDRTPRDRALAVTYTEVEKARAYYKTYVLDWTGKRE